MSQTKAQLISDLVQALAFVATSSAPTNGMYLSAANTMAISTNGNGRLFIASDGKVGVGTNAPAFSNGDGLEIQREGTACLRLDDNVNSKAGEIYADSTGLNIDGRGTGAVINFDIGGTTKATLDNSGRLLVGTSSTSTNTRALFQATSANSAGSGNIYLARGESTPADGADLGAILFSDSGHAGSSVIYAARDGGTWTSGSSQPTRLVFSTTDDGASSPTERLRITKNGSLLQYGNDVSSLTSLNLYNGTSGGDNRVLIRAVANSGGDPYIMFDSGGSDMVVGQLHGGGAANKLVLGAGTTPSGADGSGISINGSAQVFMLGVYDDLISGTTRDLYIKNDGQLGYISSVLASKTNIQDLSNVDWLYQLQPKSFNYRVQDEDGNFTDEAYAEKEYGLIAEEVEPIAPDLCFYDEIDDEQQLAGVHYRLLITPMLKALQQANTRIETLEAKVAALESA